MELCDDREMSELAARVRNGDGGDIAPLDDILKRFPNDPRLHFMRGSILAGSNRPLEAYASLAKAVELAPDFHIARYQLGFFQLTSGEADQALSTWGPLLRLPEDFYLRKFVEGLTCLIRDEFQRAIAALQEGIALNRENEPLNNDIRLLIGQCDEAIGKSRRAHANEDDTHRSATSVILGQFSDHSTRH